jgi:hypothetical protein
MLGNASLTPPTVLAAQRRSDHASYTEVGLVKLPLLKEFIDDGLLLSNTVHLGDKSRVISHAGNVEIRSKTEEYTKDDIEQRVSLSLTSTRGRCPEHIRQPVDACEEQRC